MALLVVVVQTMVVMVLGGTQMRTGDTSTRSIWSGSLCVHTLNSINKVNGVPDRHL